MYTLERRAPDVRCLGPLISWWVDMLCFPGTYSLAQGKGSGNRQAVWGKASLWWWKGGGEKSHHLFQVPEYLEPSAWVLGVGYLCKRMTWGAAVFTSIYSITQLKLIWVILCQKSSRPGQSCYSSSHCHRKSIAHLKIQYPYFSTSARNSW